MVNETIAGIVQEMREDAEDAKHFVSFLPDRFGGFEAKPSLCRECMSDLADRIEAAHKAEGGAK